jgi:hypothetical protein
MSGLSSADLTEKLHDGNAHLVHRERGRGRMKEVLNLLCLAGARSSSLTGASIYGLSFWACTMLDYDERCIAGEGRRNSVMNMRNLLYLLLIESPAVCLQHLKRQTTLAHAIGHNKSLSKTRARFHHLWRNGFTKILIQQRLSPGDFEHRRRPLELISGYNGLEDLGDGAAGVGVCQQAQRRTRARTTVGQVHALTLRRTREQAAASRKTLLDRRCNRLGRTARAKAAHEVGVPA